MSEVEVFSPAKINLFLAVVGKRTDGFHDIVSLVAPLDFGDSIRASVIPSGIGLQLSCSDPDLPIDSSNLVYKAAQLYLERFKINAFVSVHIDKRIPIGAGLGGGSSNAASTLLALDRLFGMAKSEEIHALAEKIGSDCPMFLHQGPSILRGRGERVEALENDSLGLSQEKTICLFKPSFSVSTTWAYERMAEDPSNYASAEQAEAALGGLPSTHIEFKSLLYNSFEKILFPKFPALELLLKEIRGPLGLPALVSGSGSGCFAICESENVAKLRELVYDSWGPKAFFQTARIGGSRR